MIDPKSAIDVIRVRTQVPAADPVTVHIRDHLDHHLIQSMVAQSMTQTFEVHQKVNLK